jgi:thiamine-monophosphate kinase
LSTETALIDDLIRRARRYRDGQTLTGPGDDGAVLAGLPGGLVVSSDCFVEGTHFKRPWLDPEDLATRCLGAALSDLAAMGAVPRFYTMDLVLRGDEDPLWLAAFADQLGSLGERFKIDLIGGDLTRGVVQMIGITVIGSPPNGRSTRRSGARPGDSLWVSGSLGGAAAGLAWLGAKSGDRSELSAAFRQPEPRILLGIALAKTRLASASIDLSDGLVMDLQRLCDASGCGAQLDRRRLPVDRRCGRICQELGGEPLDLALYGGEDYELLFSVAPAMQEAIGDLASATTVALTRIGMMTQGSGVVDETGAELERRGWDPFSEG